MFKQTYPGIHSLESEDHWDRCPWEVSKSTVTVLLTFPWHCCQAAVLGHDHKPTWAGFVSLLWWYTLFCWCSQRFSFYWLIYETHRSWAFCSISFDNFCTCVITSQNQKLNIFVTGSLIALSNQLLPPYSSSSESDHYQIVFALF